MSKTITTVLDNINNSFVSLPKVTGITSKDASISSNISEMLRSRKESEIAKEMFTGKSDNSGLSIATKVDRDNTFKYPLPQNSSATNNNSNSQSSTSSQFNNSQIRNNNTTTTNNYSIYQEEKRPVRFESNNVDINRFILAMEKIKSGETKVSLSPTINVNIPQNVSIPDTTLWVNTNNNPESATIKNMGGENV
jgi:hypothetical protein